MTDITILKTFLEVYRTRHFSKAASNLFVTQSAVSARIRQLEYELGVRLFTRDRNNIQPTTSGQKLYAYAESMLNSWNRMQKDVAVVDERRIPIVVVSTPSLWDAYLNEWIISANERFPDIVYTCEYASADLINRRLVEGSADIGLTYEPLLHAELQKSGGIGIELVMVSSTPDQTPGQALGSNYVQVDWGSAFTLEHTGSFPDLPVAILYMSTGNAAREFILRRGGTAYLPQAMVVGDLESGRLFAVRDAPGIRREAFFVHLGKGSRGELIRNIVETCG